MKKYLKYLFFLIILYHVQIKSQNVFTAGFGNAETSLLSETLGKFSNPASYSIINTRQASIGVAPSPFGMKDLITWSVGYIEHFELFNLSASFESFGFDLFKKYSPALIISKKFFNNLFVGLNLHYQYFNIKNYGSDGSLGLDLGCIVMIAGGINWGFSFSNFNSPAIGIEKEKLEQIFRMGISGIIEDKLYLGLDIHKELKYPANICFGFNYNILTQIFVRAGINTEPSKIFGGIGLKYNSLLFDYSFSYHNALGLSHEFSINIFL